MVSTAAGMARHGLLPVVNSFASFLASRANEQIYNQASEGSKVVYALHYAGLIPAGPGKSHQSVRDISLLAALPNVAIVQPGSRGGDGRARSAGRWRTRRRASRVRLAIGPSPRRIELPACGRSIGRGTVLRDGSDAVLVSYGPVMLHEALLAAERLARAASCRFGSWRCRGSTASTWTGSPPRSPPSTTSSCSRTTRRWAASATGFGRALPGRAVTVFGVEGWPACGTPDEALRFHGLDGASLAARIAVARRRSRRSMTEARLGRPPRSALDPRLRRHGDRERAPRAARREPRRGVPRAPRGGGGVGRPAARTSRCCTATSSPLRAGFPTEPWRGSTPGSTAGSATTRSRCG